MNLLYISKLSNNPASGPNQSVPAGVAAQQKYDNVLWVDLNPNAFQEHWGKVEAYHNINEFGKKVHLDILPVPFNHPDCVVFEGFYMIEHVLFAKKLRKRHIPYIIIPRGSFTRSAFHNGSILKYIKKKIAYLFVFNSYIYNAASIQYLTETEKEESVFKTPYFIIPNGITIPKEKKNGFSSGIKAVFIGRQDIKHKGLDLLFSAISDLHSELCKAGFFLDIYGPARYNVKQVSQMIQDMNLSDVVQNHEVGVRGEEKKQVLLQSDLFILTSRFEGHPMGLIEALAYGLPCLITRGANMLEEIQSSDAGWTCEISAESIKDALRQMISDKNLFEGKSRNARTLAALYNWDSLAMQFHEQIKQILK